MVRLLDEDDRGEDIHLLENLLGVAEIHHRAHPGFLAEEPAKRLAVAGLHPFVGDYEAEEAARLQRPHAQFVEIDIQVRHAVEDFVVGLQPQFVGAEQFLPDVGRVADDDIEAALGEDLGEGGLPVKGLGMDRRVADDAVALADGVVEFSSSCQASQKRIRALRCGSLRAARS